MHIAKDSRCLFNKETVIYYGQGNLVNKTGVRDQGSESEVGSVRWDPLTLTLSPKGEREIKVPRWIPSPLGAQGRIERKLAQWFPSPLEGRRLGFRGQGSAVCEEGTPSP